MVLVLCLPTGARNRSRPPQSFPHCSKPSSTGAATTTPQRGTRVAEKEEFHEEMTDKESKKDGEQRQRYPPTAGIVEEPVHATATSSVGAAAPPGHLYSDQEALEARETSSGSLPLSRSSPLRDGGGGGQAIRSVDVDVMADIVRVSELDTAITIDARSFLEYNTCHIMNSYNVYCSKIVKRRLQGGKVSVMDLLASACDMDLDPPNTDVFVYDQNTEDYEHLSSDSFQHLFLGRLSAIFRTVQLLKGGFLAFQAAHPSLCETKLADCKGATLLSVSQPCMPVSNIGPTRILPHLYLGSQEDALNSEILKKNGITYVLNVSLTCPRSASIQEEHYLQIPINDNYSAKMTPHFDKAFNFLEKVRSGNGCALIHCLAGISRSPSLAIAYLMRHLNMSSDDAYRYVKEKRPTISPNFNFLGQLLEYEHYLKSIVAAAAAAAAAPIGATPSPTPTPGTGSFTSSDLMLSFAANIKRQTQLDISAKGAEARAKLPKLSFAPPSLTTSTVSPTTQLSRLSFGAGSRDASPMDEQLPLPLTSLIEETPSQLNWGLGASVPTATAPPLATGVEEKCARAALSFSPLPSVSIVAPLSSPPALPPCASATAIPPSIGATASSTSVPTIAKVQRQPTVPSYALQQRHGVSAPTSSGAAAGAVPPPPFVLSSLFGSKSVEKSRTLPLTTSLAPFSLAAPSVQRVRSLPSRRNLPGYLDKFWQYPDSGSPVSSEPPFSLSTATGSAAGSLSSSSSFSSRPLSLNLSTSASTSTVASSNFGPPPSEKDIALTTPVRPAAVSVTETQDVLQKQKSLPSLSLGLSTCTSAPQLTLPLAPPHQPPPPPPASLFPSPLPTSASSSLAISSSDVLTTSSSARMMSVSASSSSTTVSETAAPPPPPIRRSSSRPSFLHSDSSSGNGSNKSASKRPFSAVVSGDASNQEGQGQLPQEEEVGPRGDSVVVTESSPAGSPPYFPLHLLHQPPPPTASTGGVTTRLKQSQDGRFTVEVERSIADQRLLTGSPLVPSSSSSSVVSTQSSSTSILGSTGPADLPSEAAAAGSGPEHLHQRLRWSYSPHRSPEQKVVFRSRPKSVTSVTVQPGAAAAAGATVSRPSSIQLGVVSGHPDPPPSEQRRSVIGVASTQPRAPPSHSSATASDMRRRSQHPRPPPAPQKHWSTWTASVLQDESGRSIDNSQTLSTVITGPISPSSVTTSAAAITTHLEGGTGPHLTSTIGSNIIPIRTISPAASKYPSSTFHQFDLSSAARTARLEAFPLTGSDLATDIDMESDMRSDLEVTSEGDSLTSTTTSSSGGQASWRDSAFTSSTTSSGYATSSPKSYSSSARQSTLSTDEALGMMAVAPPYDERGEDEEMRALALDQDVMLVALAHTAPSILQSDDAKSNYLDIMSYTDAASAAASASVTQPPHPTTSSHSSDKREIVAMVTSPGDVNYTQLDPTSMLPADCFSATMGSSSDPVPPLPPPRLQSLAPRHMRHGATGGSSHSIAAAPAPASSVASSSAPSASNVASSSATVTLSSALDSPRKSRSLDALDAATAGFNAAAAATAGSVATDDNGALRERQRALTISSGVRQFARAFARFVRPSSHTGAGGSNNGDRPSSTRSSGRKSGRTRRTSNSSLRSALSGSRSSLSSSLSSHSHSHHSSVEIIAQS